MDAREIIWQDLGTCVQVTKDAQMIFLWLHILIKNQPLSCFSAISPKPLLKHFQEPGIGLSTSNSIWTPQLASFAAPHYREIQPSQWNLVFSQLFTKTAYEGRIWLFQQQWDHPVSFGFGRKRQKHTISAHKEKNYKTWSHLGVSILPGKQSSLSFTVSAMELFSIFSGFCLLNWGFFCCCFC